MTEPPAAEDRTPFFAVALDLLCVAGLDGWLRDVNPAWERALGLSREELLARPFIERVHPDDVPAVEEQLDSIRRGEPTGTFECRIQTGDGPYRWFRWFPDHVVRDGQIFAVARDVTDTRRREESDRESQASFGLLTEAVERHLITIHEQAELLEAANDAILVRDFEGRILYWNHGAEQVYGWGRTEALGQVTHSLLGTIFPVPFESIRAQLLETGSWAGELLHRRRDGEELRVASRWAIRRDLGRSGPTILEINTDVTDRRAAEEGLRESEARFRAVFLSAAMGIGLADLEGRLVEANPALAELLGRDAEFLVGSRLSEFAAEDDRHADEEPLTELLDGTHSSYRVDRRYVRPDGTVVPARETLSAVRDEAGRPRFVVTMVEDLSLALIDHLTGLHNRRAFLAFGEKQLRLAGREHRRATLLFLDLDDLKHINDTFGHSEGDRALAELASLMVGTLRSSDFVARFGGDEFCALLVHDGGDDRGAVTRLEGAVAAASQQNGRPYPLSVSIGAATFDWQWPVSIEALIAEADRAMYHAKADPEP